MIKEIPISYSSERIRKLLKELVVLTYAEKESKEVVEKMQQFWFYFEVKEGKIAGVYQSDIHRIIIKIFSRPAGHILVCCIHELAHHVDFIIRNETRHDHSFYQVFYDLLISAMRINLISKEQLLAVHDTKDVENLQKRHGYISSWEIPALKQKKRKAWIKCRSSLEKKEYLKKAKYQYSWFEKAWFKEVPAEQIQVEIDYLKRYFKDKEFQVETIDTIKFSVMYYVSLRNGRIHRELLKERGYYYEAYDLGKFTWNKIINASDWQKEKEALNQLIGLKTRILLR
ncbi:hypothetical protein HB892_14190 [Listeria welshimeri]|uniref:hypothetical protein n=1 Tax=Listeria welshimeri TaxID=1643 RepID=UPI001629FF39|nr:hypothetical protein [Listeria welshimeri]MBC1478882.1 hypothetical protein [Listeria welshimeri]MBF2598324.1 hypothetical protein [Listeria welshimeri]MBF2614940.1 hypothetical protein [Listeria welshimeri]